MNSRHQIRPNSGIDNNAIKSVSSAFAIGSTTLQFSCGLEELTAKKTDILVEMETRTHICLCVQFVSHKWSLFHVTHNIA